MFTVIPINRRGICQDEIDDMGYSKWDALNKDQYRMARFTLVSQVPPMFIYYDKRSEHMTWWASNVFY